MSTPETSLSLSASLVHLTGEPSHSGKVIQLDRRLSIVGSKRGAHIRINSPQVSGSHALLLNLGHQVLLRDAMSRSGVFVNDVPIRDHVLKCGDVIRFGPHQFRFEENALVVRQQPAPARSLRGLLRVEGMPEPILIAMPMFVIGSRREADLHLQGDEISQAHAVIVEHCGRRMIRDLNSRLGVRVNGKKVQKAILRDGDVIGIGSWELRFSSSALRRARVLSRGPTAGSSAEQSPASPPRRSGDSGHTDIWEKPAELNNNANSQTLQDLNLSDDERVTAEEDKLGDFAQQSGVTAACSDPIESPIVKEMPTQAGGIGNEATVREPMLALEIVPTVIDTPPAPAAETEPELTPDPQGELIEAVCLATDWVEPERPASIPTALDPGPVDLERLDEPSLLVDVSSDDSIFGRNSLSDVPEAAAGTETELAGGTDFGADSAVVIEQLGTSEDVSPSTSVDVADLTAAVSPSLPSGDPADLTAPLSLDELSPQEQTSSPARATAVSTADPLADIVGPEILPLFPDTPHADEGQQSRDVTGQRRYPFILKLTLTAASLFAIIGAAGWWYLHRR